ncbi:ribonuclease H-like domain-containing protein [Halalkalibacter alkalisediminis]|uniref:Ribonuclease H-like domain-containing protein n=1 Tax=Halalkalibacter alkalisediminis TaxID=935616 RepID=A0ABV6NGU5_9BACI|nr:ribonuclease H-like domain-containing protein [Halalkalibacter alkalisediminis]
MSMKNKLARMKQHLGMKEDLKPAPVLEETKHPNVIPYETEWDAFGTKALWFEDGYTLLREKVYPLNHQHGRYLFSDINNMIHRWQDHQLNHPLSAKGRSVSDLIFFDTETTGLSSGVGNTIFMLGYCRLQSDSVKVKQYFLPGPEAEVALYHHFLTEVGTLGNLVTYNGKAFDWPQVKTRHTFVRDQVPKLPKFGHFDLLHASRRLWKESLPSCKLSVVEKEILNFERVEDTPSYMVPMLYFDFLQEQDPEFVKGIFHHHEWDVLSLMTLYTHLSSLILDCEGDAIWPREKYELARWYEALGEKEIAMNLYEQLKGVGDEVAEASLFAYAKGKKQQGDYTAAIESFLKLVGTKGFTYLAAVESSKLYEHQFKDVEKALYYSEEVMKNNDDYVISQPKTKQEKMIKELEQRIERLERKRVM